MDPFAPMTVALALFAATMLALRALRRRSLTKAGACTGFVVGFLLVSTGLRGLVLFYFYQIGSMATHYKEYVKAKLDATVVSERGATQVLAVSLVAVVLSLTHALYCGAEQAIDFTAAPEASRLAMAILAHHAVSLGDTLASELGMLGTVTRSQHSQQPILVTQPWRRVPVGTNGGISALGTVWSFVGGLIIGAVTVAMDYFSGISPLNFGRVTLFGGLTGFLGSLLDSILGATLQTTYYDDETKLVYHEHHTNRPKSAQRICGVSVLTNEQVNFVSVAITSVIGGWIIAPWFFGL